MAVPPGQLAFQRIFTDYKNIVDHCCWAWSDLADRPWKIISIGLRDWAHGF
jgi:hypothetical protein